MIIQEPEPIQETPAARETIHVAVVEDNANLRESLRTMLDYSQGMCCVAACDSGEDAVTRLPEVQPDVVFMDINLPRMNGVECVRRLVALLQKPSS